MTPAEITAIRERVEELDGYTPGPWNACNNPGDWGLAGAWNVAPLGANPYEWDQCIVHVEYTTPYCLGASRKEKDAAAVASCNARLIAAAPTLHADVQALLAQVAEMAAENARLHSIVARFVSLPCAAWHPERHAAEEAELMQRARAALAGKGGAA